MRYWNVHVYLNRRTNCLRFGRSADSIGACSADLLPNRLVGMGLYLHFGHATGIHLYAFLIVCGVNLTSEQLLNSSF